MSKLVMTMGLPASGKTLWANKKAESSGGNWKIVCMDDIRAMYDAGKYTKSNEKIVKAHQMMMVNALLDTGFNVIVADTNLAPARKELWKKVAKERGIQFEVKSFLHVGVDVCIERDLARPNSVGEHVIMRMYKQFVKPMESQGRQYEADGRLPKAIVVDIDGTLAHMTTRGPFAWKRVGEDDLDATVADMVAMYDREGYYIILLSGRDGVCEPETKAWLSQHSVPYDELYMRPAGNCDKDTLIKERMFFDKVAPFYNVKFVLDDRACVVDMWRGIGVQCFQVAEGNF